jgi:hypothetical protein
VGVVEIKELLHVEEVLVLLVVVEEDGGGRGGNGSLILGEGIPVVE